MIQQIRFSQDVKKSKLKWTTKSREFLYNKKYQPLKESKYQLVFKGLWFLKDSVGKERWQEANLWMSTRAAAVQEQTVRSSAVIVGN